LEVAFTEAFVALALNDFKENRADLVFGENLQQQVVVGAAVKQNAIFLQAFDIFAVIGQPGVEQFVISIGRIQKTQLAGAQIFDGVINGAGAQRDMLDSFTAIHIKVFLNLAFFFRSFFVDRDTDFAA